VTVLTFERFSEFLCILAEDEEESDIESEPAHSDEEDDEPIQSKKRKRPVETVSRYVLLSKCTMSCELTLTAP
jgi:hypothetical protein